MAFGDRRAAVPQEGEEPHSFQGCAVGEPGFHCGAVDNDIHQRSCIRTPHVLFGLHVVHLLRCLLSFTLGAED